MADKANKAKIWDAVSHARVSQQIAALVPEEKWDVQWVKSKTKRSIDQNALYWFWVEIIRKETGYTDKQDVHEALMEKFLVPRNVVNFDGEVKEKYSTKKMRVAEFREYLNMIEAWAHAEMNIYLPIRQDLEKH